MERLWQSLRVENIAGNSPERSGFSPAPEFSTESRPERRSSSLVRIDCHLTEKTLMEWEREIREVVSLMARRRLGSPAEDSGELGSL